MENSPPALNEGCAASELENIVSPFAQERLLVTPNAGSDTDTMSFTGPFLHSERSPQLENLQTEDDGHHLLSVRIENDDNDSPGDEDNDIFAAPCTRERPHLPSAGRNFEVSELGGDFTSLYSPPPSPSAHRPSHGRQYHSQTLSRVRRKHS